MRKRHHSVLVALCLVLFVAAPGIRGSIGMVPASAQSAVDPQEALVQAWARVREAGSYRFLSTADQTLVPRPIPEMIGQSDVRLTLESDGAVILPDRSYVGLRVAGAGQARSVTLLHDGGQAYMLQDGVLHMVDDPLSLASPTTDVLGYLAAAEQVTRLEPPEGHPELARYAFVISGPRFAEYVRQQAEADLRAEPGAPDGLTLGPAPALQELTGHGELWVNEAGLPVRQVLDIQMPEVNQAYGAQIHMVADLVAYGQVEALPRAVQDADGTWRLQGTLVTGAADSGAALHGVTTEPRQSSQVTVVDPATLEAEGDAVGAAAGDGATVGAGWPARLAGITPLRVDPSIPVSFIALVLAILVMRYYRRDPRRCYALVVLFLAPVLVFASLLQAGQVLLFMDRQARAAETRAVVAPDMLRALGLQTQDVQPGQVGDSSGPYRRPAADAGAATGALPPAPAARDAAVVPLQEEGWTIPTLARCGDGEPGVDTDMDGLTDQVELCLGTDPNNPDTDNDGIDDRTELYGFDLGGQHWDSDPLSADSNRDGIMDGSEWPSDLAPHGTAANADLDGDGIPNLWDDDDDGDLVPDALDLSYSAVTDYTTEFTLSTSGEMVTGTQSIEFELQPHNMDHLRYSTTALDWPADQDGNIQDLDDSTEDLRLLPFLLVTTNIAPDAGLLDQYGVRSWVDDQGRTVLLVTLQPLEDGGAIYAFYGKVAYGAGQTGDIQWDAKLVWMAQMQQDRLTRAYNHSTGHWYDMVVTEPVTVHQYQDTFRITGLQITKSERFEATVMGTPSMPGDDRYLFQLLLGLSSTYGGYGTLEGQDEANGETALEEIAERFAAGYAGNETATFNIPSDTVAVAPPVTYPNAEAGMAGLSDRVLQFLDTHPAYSNVPLCTDAEGNAVTCASLIIATESHSGTQDLSDMAGADPRMVDLDELHVDLDNVPVFAARSISLRMYEREPVTLTWRATMPARMLEIIEARYGGAGGGYDTTLTELYPTLRAQDWRFIAYSIYLWAYAGRMLAVSVDGQPLVPEDIDEDAVAVQYTYTVPAELSFDSALAYMGLATNLPGILGDSFSVGQGAFDIGDVLWKRSEFLGSKLGKANMAGHLTLGALGAACSVASLIMGSINTACEINPDKAMCKNEGALLAANLTIGVLSMAVQATAIVYNIAESVVKHLQITMKNFSALGSVLGWVGAGIGITMAWVSFGIIAARGGGDPISWRVALGMAIMTTIWLVCLALLNMIPVVGPIISAILSLIDYIIGLFTGLFTNETWGIAKIVLELFYDARVCTSLESAEFGTFSSRLDYPDMGLVAGNKYTLELPGSGSIVKETEGANRGTNDDLRRSYVRSVLVSPPIGNDFDVQDKSQPIDCVISGGRRECANTAALGFSLASKINGAFTLVAKMLYATVWAEYTLYAVRVSTHVETGELPEEGLDPTTIYLDVLPATLTELWSWSALGNPDRDGDGLTNDEEIALGTDPDLWDTDGDGLSDRYEIETESARGADVLLADTDGDGLSDALERRFGTRINATDSDGDGLTDGEEVRRLEGGVLVGGWRIAPPSGLETTGVGLTQDGTFSVSSDPLVRDDDADSLNAWDERANGLSPHARNALVPEIRLTAEPFAEIPYAGPGMYWTPGTDVSFTIGLGNWSTEPVTTPLSLTLPDWLTEVSGGAMEGDRTPPMVQEANTLTWSFSEGNTLQVYEVVSTTVTARVHPDTTSARGGVSLDLLFGDMQMHRSVQATVDGDVPRVAMMAPLDGAYLRGTSYVVGGTATDPTTWITEASLSIVPEGNAADYYPVGASTGQWAYTWSLPEDGVYSLEARAVDAMQHESTAGPIGVTVDNTRPVATLAWEMAGSRVHLSGTATDNLSGVKWVQLAIDGQPWRNVPLEGSGWSYDWTVGESAQGKHDVRVRAIDRSGNESALVTQEITVDRVAPSSIVNAGADPDVPVAVRAGSPFTLSGVADEGGHLPLPASPTNLQLGLDVLDDSTVWLGLSTIHDNDGGVLAAWVGDFNADRLSDLAVGLPGPEGDAGLVAMVYGRAGGWPVPPDLEMLANSGTRFVGAPGARLGSLLAAAGDVNGDAMDDLLIGERDAARAFLVFGRPSMLGGATLDAGQSGYRTMLQAPAVIQSLAAAGDVNGDGTGDLLIVAGGTAYLVLGRSNPWPEMLDVSAEAVATWGGVTGARGLGDVDNDQLAEWATLANGVITLYGWNTNGGYAELVRTVQTADAYPRVVAVGDVDGNGYGDWLYAHRSSRILVYGGGATPHTFSGMDGFIAAPGDVDGDGRADILLTDAAGTASLIRQEPGSSPEVFATIAGVGGAANAPYTAGADLNADGSTDLLLIPNQAAAEARGYDAPDVSSGFISPQALPLGVSSAGGGSVASQMLGMTLQSVGPDTRYVDDDAVGGVCDGHSDCYTTIQDAVDASDGGGDTIIVYPGAYGGFRVPAGGDYDYLTIQGVSADAVFVDGDGSDAIRVAADGVHLSNLTVRNATSGVLLEADAGEPTWSGGDETAIDHLVAHSVQHPISMSQAAALTVSDSTLVGNGTHPIISVGSTPDATVHTWHQDRALTGAIGRNAALASAADALYAMPGGTDRTVYTATPGVDGALGPWSAAFQTLHGMPQSDGASVIAAGGDYLYQMHSVLVTPDFGVFNGEVRAVAVAPNGDVYVGGSFTLIGGTYSANNIARWDGAQWQRLGTALSNGVDGAVYAITIVSTGDVYVGGQFGRVFDGTEVPARNIARWNGSQWLTLGEAVVGGNGVSGAVISGESVPEEDVAVYALTHTDDDVVVIGGRFRRAHESLSDHENVWNFAFYHPTRWWDDYASTWWQYMAYYGGIGQTDISHCVRSLVWGGGLLQGTPPPNYVPAGKLYAGGRFTRAGDYDAANVAYWQFSSGGGGDFWHPFGSGVPDRSISDVAWDASTSRVYAVSDDAASAGIYRWDGSTWGTVVGVSGAGSALAVDWRGNVYAGMVNGDFRARRAGDLNFGLQTNEGTRVWDLALDGSGQVLMARGDAAAHQGGIRYCTLEGLLRRNPSGGNWEWFTYPSAFNKEDLPTAVVADSAGNVYANDRWSDYYVVYRFNAASKTWELRASLLWNGHHSLKSLAWADGSLYGLAHSTAAAGEDWYLYRHDTAAAPPPGVTGEGWTSLGLTPLPAGASLADTLSWAWDGADSLYVLAGSKLYRYRISAATWDSLPNPTVAFTASRAPAMAPAGDNLYVYATPGTGATSNLFRYGAVGMPDLRLTVERTALVMPDAASSLPWTSLTDTSGTYRFATSVDATNAWVGPDGVSWSPALPSGGAELTSAQAAFAAPVDGLYRLSADSTLTAGYHAYTAVAHVYTSQAACSECASGGLVWGETAFATVREAIESGAARVLVHPGRYPQTFHLVSGVEVIGSGAENTIITPPASDPATLVTAEGVAHASLGRMTLAGGADWEGFLVEGGAEGLLVTRSIFRDLHTGLRLREGSTVEVVNNTIARNIDGLVIEDTTPVDVRNTIIAYNSGTGLQYGASPASLSNTYNGFWANGTDMNPSETSLGSLYVDPRFRSLPDDDLRLAADSPMIDQGAPGDPTVPGGARVDMGYAEYNAAGFYVSPRYSETSLNDGLTWGIDAFGSIQAALDAAAVALRGLQGAVPQGGYSVAVDEGTYVERVSVPSHVRLVGSGADVTTIDAGNAGSTVTFAGVIDAELSHVTVQSASAGAAGVDLRGATSGITITHNVIQNNAGAGVRLENSSSGAVRSSTIVGNGGAGVHAAGVGTWAEVRNNILSGNAYGLQAASGGLVRNDYNLLHNTMNVSGVSAGANTVSGDPAFAETGYYVLTPGSPALDAADPLVVAPPAGGVRADLGYRELTASPLTLLFGPQVASTVVGSSGVQRVEVAVVPISDATQPVTATLPTAWDTLTPPTTGQPLFYWSHSVNPSAPGLYRVYSRATDAVGNVEVEAGDWYEGDLVVDDTAPTVSWGATLPVSTDAAAVLAVVVAEGTVTTGTGARDDVDQVYLVVTGPSGTLAYPVEGGQAWIPLPAPGSYAIKAIAVDEAGNQAEASASVAVSASDSVVTVTNLNTGGAVNNTAVALRGYVRFTAGGAGHVDVSVAGGETVRATLDTPGAAFSAWSAKVALPAGDGVKPVTVTPSLGGVSGAATTLDLILDTTAPTLQINQPAPAECVFQVVDWTGTATDPGAGLAQVEVSMDGGYTWQRATIDGDAWSLSQELAERQDYVSYPARVRAVDAAGNLALIERPVALDSVPPTDLAPLTFSAPEGQHMEIGTSLMVGWNAPVDGSGSTEVLLAVDQSADTVPSVVEDGASASVGLDTLGDWYVHLMAQDAAGNQIITHYGPWHVRDMGNEVFGSRRQSILLDGFIDLEYDEWLADDLLGTDAQGVETQQLYATWDGEGVYLGWSGAWWTLDGAMWAYLDVADGGSAQSVDGMDALPIAADLAVLIDSPEAGSLHIWNGSTWGAANPLAFAHGSAGDSEAYIPWSLTSGQTVQLVAFALPPATAASLTALASGHGGALLAASGGARPWAIFPNTNPLGQDATTAYIWNTPDVSQMNAGQPDARTVWMDVTSPQAGGTAWCAGSTLEYVIKLENPGSATLADLTLTLTATAGLGYQSVSGATRTAGTEGDATWTLAVPTLGAGETALVTATAWLADDLSGLEQVVSTFNLSSESAPLTGSPLVDLRHHVDGAAPAVVIDAAAGAAISAGWHTFTGKADDGNGSGVVYVEVSLDGGSTWHTAVGTLAWVAALDVPGEAEEVTLQARAVDACGRATDPAGTQVFYVDQVPPEVSWALPDVVTTTAALLGGDAHDPAPMGALVQRVEVQIDSDASAWLATNGPYAPQDGTQAWNWNWYSPRDDGVEHQLRARATDGTGNTTLTGWQTVLVDVVAPQVATTAHIDTVLLPSDLLPPVQDDGFRTFLPCVQRGDDGSVTHTATILLGEPMPLLRGTVTDGSGVWTVRIRVYDPLGGVSVEQATWADGVWEFAPDVAGWELGLYALWVEAVDIHGNLRVLGPYPLALQEHPIGGLTASPNGPAVVGQAVTLTAYGAGSNVSYAWDLGDGETADGRVVQHAYAQAGEYTVVVTATNSVSTMTATTAVTILPWLTVEAGADQTITGGDTVSVLATFVHAGAQGAHTASIDWGDDAANDAGVDEESKIVSSSHQYLDDGTYTVTVTVRTEEGDEASDTFQVTVNNVAPTIALSGAESVDEGAVYTLTLGEVTDADDDTVTAWTVYWGDGTSDTYDSGGDVTHIYADGPSSLTIVVDLTDEDGLHTEAGGQSIRVDNASPEVVASPESQTVQYSETVVVQFAATDAAMDTMTAALSWSTDGVGFRADPLPDLVLTELECAEGEGANTCSWVVGGTVTMPEGVYTLRLTVTDKDGGVTDSDATLIVEPAEALVTFAVDNPLVMQTAAAQDSADLIRLQVCASGLDAELPGDITLAEMSLSLVPVDPGGAIQGVAEGEPMVGDGRQCVTFGLDKVLANTYAVQVTVDGGYYAGYGEDVLVVGDPTSGFAGGGWFDWPGTERDGYSGDKTTLGYTIAYDESGTDARGCLLLIRRLTDGTIYRVHSNTLRSITLGEDSDEGTEEPFGWATIAGECAYQEPGWPEPVSGYEFTGYVEDRDEPGTGTDRVWIEVVGGLLLPGEAPDEAVEIVGGDIVVLHGAR